MRRIPRNANVVARCSKGVQQVLQLQLPLSPLLERALGRRHRLEVVLDCYMPLSPIRTPPSSLSHDDALGEDNGVTMLVHRAKQPKGHPKHVAQYVMSWKSTW